METCAKSGREAKETHVNIIKAEVGDVCKKKAEVGDVCGREAKETHVNIGRRKGDVASVGDDVIEYLFTTCRGGGGLDNRGVTNHQASVA